MGEIKLIKIQHPFNRQKRTEEVVDYNHENLQVIRDTYFPKDINVIVSVNGGVVSQENLKFVTLKAGDEVVFLPEIVGGGGDILRAVAMLAVMAIAIYAPVAAGLYTTTTVFGGTLEMAFATQVFSGLTLAGSLMSAGIMLAGGYLINALLPAPVPDIDTYSGSSFDNSNTYSWNPVTRQQQGLVIPKFYGLIPVYGNVISTYTENISEKNYVNVLLNMGQGPINRLYDFYLNDQPITGLTGVDIYTRYGFINQSVIPNFNDTKAEYTTNVKCTYNTPYVYETTGNAFDGLEVDITFPRGLYYANDQGGLSPVSVDIRVEIRKKGTTDWTSISKQSITTARTVDRGYWVCGWWNQEYGYERQPTGRSIFYPYFTGSSNPADHYEGEYHSTSYSMDASGYSSYTALYWHWISQLDTEYAEEVVFYTTVTDAKNSAIIKTFKSESNLSHGTYEVRVTRLTADYSNARYGADSYLTAVREVVTDDFQYPRSVLVGVKALATDQLSGSLKFRCMQEGSLIRYYDGNDWQIGYNNNPAWVCYDILTQPLFADPDEVVGTDGLNYRCILDHTASSSNEPVTGANYATYWQQTGDQGKTWVIDTAYKTWSPIALRYDGINPARLDTVSFKEWADWCDELVLSGKSSTNLDSGTVTSATTTTLTDSTKTWTYEAWVEKVVEIISGTGSGQRRFIKNNSETSLIVDPVWTTTPDGTSTYAIREDYERNFTFNGGFDSGTNLWEAALQIALMSRALLIWDGTTIKVIIDKAVTLPNDVAQLFSMGNIDINSFEETFLSSSERTGEIELNFINKDINYEKDSCIVFNTALEKPENRNTVTLLGTTNPSQAWRMGYFFLKQNELLLRTIKFDAEIDAITCMIGDVIYFQHDIPQWGVCGGRVVPASQVIGGDNGLNYTCKLGHVASDNNRPGMSPPRADWETYWVQSGDAGSTWVSGSSYKTSSTNNTVTLDREVTIENGKTYSIMLWLNENTLVNKTVTNSAGTTDVISISGTWATNPSEYNVFAFGESDNTAKPFRVIEVSRTSDLKCTIRAIEYNADVYDVDSETPILSEFSYSTRTPIAAVTNLNISEIASINESGASNRRLLVTFSRPVNIYYSHAEIWYKEGSGIYKYAGRADTEEFYINNLAPNTDYTIKVISVSYAGIKTTDAESPTSSITTERDLSTATSILEARVTGLEIFNQRNNNAFTGKDCRFRWNNITSVNTTSTGAGHESAGAGTYIPPIWLKDYEVKIYDSNGTTLRRTEYVTTNEYTYTFEKNYDDGNGTPVRNFQIQVRARDIFYKVSNIPAKLTVTNDAPAALTNITVSSGTGYYITEFSPSTAPDLLGYKVHASQTKGFTPETSNIVNDGADTRVVVSPNHPGTWYVRVAAYDTFGTIDLNYSNEYTVNVTNWLEYDDIELEFMKMSFNSVSWAQFAIFDDFVTEEKREVPDPFVYEAVRYKNNIIASGNLPNTVYGWTTKTFFDVTTIDSGTSTEVGLQYLKDTSKNWYTDEMKNAILVDVDLHSVSIESNDSNTLTIANPGFTPSAGVYTIKDANPAYMVCYCTFEDSTEGGGKGFVKMEVSFDDGANWQTVLDTENNINVLEGTVAIENPGTDYKVRFSLKTDENGESPVVRKYLVATDPSPWRW